MRAHLSRMIRLAWLSAAVLLAGIDGGSGADLEIDEPAFGFSYVASQASFQQISTRDLGAACVAQARAHFFPPGKFVKTLYLYGEYRQGDTSLRIVGDRDGTSIFIQRGARCSVAPVVVAFQQLRHDPPAPTDPPVLSPTETQGVFADLLQRYAAAFGGKAKFLAWLDRLTAQALAQCKGKSESYCPPTWHILPPDLQGMLARFREAGSG